MATRVGTIGEIPPGVKAPAAITWGAGVRLSQSAWYRFQLISPGAAALSIDGVELGKTAGGAPIVVDVAAAKGEHYLAVTSRIELATDKITLSRSRSTRKLARSGDLLFADRAPARRADDVTGDFSVSWPAPPHRPVARQTWRRPFSIRRSRPASWIATRRSEATRSLSSGRDRLLAPRDGVYRFGLATDGDATMDLDGHPAGVQSLKVEAWKENTAGTSPRLTAGSHAIKVTLVLTRGPRSVLRLNWVPPLANGSADMATTWSVVPPDALRPATPIWQR